MKPRSSLHRQPLNLLFWALIGLSCWINCTKEHPTPKVKILPTSTKHKAIQTLAPVTVARQQGTQIAIAGPEGTIGLLNSESLAVLRIPTSQSQPTASITDLAIDRPARHLLATSDKSIYWWSLHPPKLRQQLSGPRSITTVAFGLTGSTAYFGTDQGHVFRWRRGQKAAEPIDGYSCEAMPVLPQRRRLPKAQRCPFGHYLTVGKQAICSYPVTHLLRHGVFLVRACRTGTVSLLDLRSRRLTHFQAGALTAISPAGKQQLALLRNDGKLRIWNTKANQLSKETQTNARPPNTQLAANTHWIAITHQNHLLIYSTKSAILAAKKRLPKPPQWIGFRPQSNELLTLTQTLNRYLIRSQKNHPK